MDNQAHMNASELLSLLLTAWGPQHWWPGETPFEVAVGAVLTQNTAWTNVQKAIVRLRAADAMSPAALLALPASTLVKLIRPAGYYTVKAGYLRTLAEWVQEHAEGDLSSLASRNPAALRGELLSLRGIGKETADSILLYAVGLPVFVIDAYTLRIASRLGLLPPAARYDDAQHFFHECLPHDARYYNEAHALLVRLGKTHCRTRPLCDGCPLAEQCPSTQDTRAPLPRHMHRSGVGTSS